MVPGKHHLNIGVLKIIAMQQKSKKYNRADNKLNSVVVKRKRERIHASISLYMRNYPYKHKQMVTLEENRAAGDSSGTEICHCKTFLNVEPRVCIN